MCGCGAQVSEGISEGVSEGVSESTSCLLGGVKGGAAALWPPLAPRANCPHNAVVSLSSLLCEFSPSFPPTAAFETFCLHASDFV